MSDDVAAQVAAYWDDRAAAPLVAHLVVHDLGGDDRLWGRRVTDERFALVARTHRP